eukprot:11722474-Prorocentrum_lima.AAC.1
MLDKSSTFFFHSVACRPRIPLQFQAQGWYALDSNFPLIKTKWALHHQLHMDKASFQIERPSLAP